jgi:hypothetical protein
MVFIPRLSGAWERWSDVSRVALVVSRIMEPTGHENPDLSRSIEIIRLLLGRIREEVPPGVRVILAHQGTDNFLMPKLGFSSAIFCQFSDFCIDLDDAVAADPAHLLPDRHWSPSGRDIERTGHRKMVTRKRCTALAANLLKTP